MLMLGFWNILNQNCLLVRKTITKSKAIAEVVKMIIFDIEKGRFSCQLLTF